MLYKRRHSNLHSTSLSFHQPYTEIWTLMGYRMLLGGCPQCKLTDSLNIHVFADNVPPLREPTRKGIEGDVHTEYCAEVCHEIASIFTDTKHSRITMYQKFSLRLLPQCGNSNLVVRICKNKICPCSLPTCA